MNSWPTYPVYPISISFFIRAGYWISWSSSSSPRPGLPAVHLGRGCNVYESPRNILRSIPGLELVEMPRNRRWAWCCGGGGGGPEAYPDLAKWNAEDRLREARESGAEILVTTSALCLRSFAESGQSQPKTQELLEFISEAI